VEPAAGKGAAGGAENAGRVPGLKTRYASGPKKRVFTVRRQPSLYHQQRLDSGSGSDAVRGENIFAASRVPWPQVSREQVLARQPQAIVIAGDASQLPAVERYWQNQLKISFIALHGDWFERASPRIILAAKQLCTALEQIK
jgi:vitamin B12 transport system substrate-binding protein